MDFYQILGLWEEAGVFDIILPFLLIFSIIYAILTKIQILGDKKMPNAVVALVAALLVVRNTYIVGLMTRFLPNVAMFLVVILMFLLLLGTLAGQHKAWKNPGLTIAFIVSLIFIVWALASDYVGDLFKLPYWLLNLDEQTKATVLFVGVFVIIIYFITREGGESKSGEEGKGIWDRLKKGVDDTLKEG